MKGTLKCTWSVDTSILINDSFILLLFSDYNIISSFFPSCSSLQTLKLGNFYILDFHSELYKYAITMYFQDTTPNKLIFFGIVSHFPDQVILPITFLIIKSKVRINIFYICIYIKLFLTHEIVYKLTKIIFIYVSMLIIFILIC